MANDKIVIKGAREHNLKNVNLTLPREKLIVMTGLSGSGKSSLAFDIIYALSGENANIGNVRETFFYNQTRLALDVTLCIQ